MTKKAATLAGEGVQFPSILQAAATSSDGIVRKFDSKINMSIENVTQSQQFKRWFGDWQKCRFFMFCKAAGNTPPTLLAACCGAFAVPQHGMAWLRDAQPPSGDGKMLAVEPQRFSRRSSTTNKKGRSKRLLPIRKHREERENGIASAVPFSHFSIDAVTFDISKAPMPL